MASSIVNEAFAERPALLLQLTGFLEYYSQARAATNYQAPDLAPIVDDIASYVRELRAAGRQAEEEPAIKKRKLNGSEGNGITTPQPPATKAEASSGSSKDVLTASWSGSTVDGVSFVVPQRKKYTLQISPNKTEGIRALNATSKAAEFGIPWGSIAQILRLPVPEKAAASHNYCIFPKGGDGLASDKTAEGYETMVWGAADAKKKNQEDVPTESEALLAALKDVKAKVVEPKESEFVSAAKHPMRKDEKQYHVKAFRGSKEGFLFFLPTGIAFVFKKPLLFFAFDAIQSVSYTSVLSRTFNLNVSAIPAANSSSDAQPMEIEFSMLDQADFAAIDEYVKRHSLQDASMAAERRAKKYNVNKVEEGADDEAGELQKAEQEANQMADDDDDESDDENFDPGSEGESEGEGDSTDGEGGEEGDGGGDDAMDEDAENEAVDD